MTGRPLLRTGATVVVIALVALALAGLGTRWGWWHFRVGFTVLRWAAWGALAGAALCVAALLAVRGPGSGRARAMAAVLGLAALAAASVPWQSQRRARLVPRIHDITTDTEDPPAFVALRERPGATNPVEYGGPEIAAQQRAGYPDLAPDTLPVPPRDALARAEATARALGWTVAAVDTAAGRLEATDRTTWFGFYDDVVVRVTPAGNGSRVDVRSLSRVGGSDVGANAARIRRFLERLGAS